MLFLDADGVLADFDTKAREVLGMPPHEFEQKYKAKVFWKALRDYRNEADEGFFESLPLMPDARELYDAVAHLKPTILTGCPLGDWAPAQKMRWAEKHFPGVPMITCMARDKIQHIENPGDILVDDKTKFQPIWEEGGGVFVHHKNTATTLVKLRALGVI